jgi:hypothetical protein
MLLLDGDRIARDRSRYMGDGDRFGEGVSAVFTPAQQNIDGVPITSSFLASLTVHQNRAALCYNDAGNAVQLVASDSAGKELLFLWCWLWLGRGRTAHGEHKEKAQSRKHS